MNRIAAVLIILASTAIASTAADASHFSLELEAGPDGDASFDAVEPAVLYNAAANEYLVAWEGNDDGAGLAPLETEIYKQRIDSSGSDVRAVIRIKLVPVTGSASYIPLNAATLAESSSEPAISAAVSSGAKSPIA